MAYAILRAEKLKSFGEIGGSLSHNYRTRHTPNADPTRTPDNTHSSPASFSVMNAIKDRLPEKIRKNAVLCIEYLITGSPEWSGWGTDKEKTYFDKAVEFLKTRHGAENVIATTIHRDETTPHLVAYVVPIDERGKLNAREFLGGRGKLSAMQTSFAEKVADLGLERGLEGSKARHTTIKSYYAEIQKPVPTAKIIKTLEIDPKIELPQLNMLSYAGVSKKEYASHAQLMAYDAAQKQIDAYAADMNLQLSQMQITWGDPVDHLYMYRETGRIPQICVNAYGELSVSPYLPITIWNLNRNTLRDYIDLEIDRYALRHPIVEKCLARIEELSDFTSIQQGLPVLFKEENLSEVVHRNTPVHPCFYRH